jgi:hypothetical protein
MLCERLRAAEWNRRLNFANRDSHGCIGGEPAHFLSISSERGSLADTRSTDPDARSLSAANGSTRYARHFTTSPAGREGLHHHGRSECVTLCFLSSASSPSGSPPNSRRRDQPLGPRWRVHVSTLLEAFSSSSFTASRPTTNACKTDRGAGTARRYYPQRVAKSCGKHLSGENRGANPALRFLARLLPRP